MNGYIEVMERDSNDRILYPIHRVLCVTSEKDGGAFIETNFDIESGATGIYTVDSYDEIKLQIQQNK